MHIRAAFLRQFTGLALLFASLVFGGSVAAKSVPDLSAPDLLGTWQLSCLEEYKGIVSVMDSKWIPDQLKNGFVIADKDGKLAEKLYGKKQAAYLAGTPTVPWLTIYNTGLQPIYHGVGYNSRSDELWQLVIEQNRPTGFAPTLYEIEPYTGVRAVDLPEADFTFIEYFAAWCTNCKLQENALADFQKSHPNLRITHVRINADTAKMQKKKYRSKPCPVTI